MKSNAKLITVGAVTVALTVVLGLFRYVFLVPVLFTCVTRDWKTSLLEGTFFGILSFLYAFMSPTPVGLTFIANPWIPIVPRMITALGCRGVYAGLRKLCKGGSKFSAAAPVVIACGAGSLFNTALVVPLLIWRGGDLFLAIIVETMIAAAIEFAVAVFIVPPVAITAGRALRLKDYRKASVSAKPDETESADADIAPAEKEKE